MNLLKYAAIISMKRRKNFDISSQMLETRTSIDFAVTVQYVGIQIEQYAWHCLTRTHTHMVHREPWVLCEPFVLANANILFSVLLYETTFILLSMQRAYTRALLCSRHSPSNVCVRVWGGTVFISLICFVWVRSHSAWYITLRIAWSIYTC